MPEICSFNPGKFYGLGLMPGKNNTKAIGQNKVQQMTVSMMPITQRRFHVGACHPCTPRSPQTARMNSGTNKRMCSGPPNFNRTTPI